MKTSLFKSLYFQVLTAIAIGILLGHFYPEIGEQMKPLGDGFVKLIKMIIAPVIFCTVVTGIAGMESMKAVGRTGAVALLYFEIVSTIALIIGLIIVNTLHGTEENFERVEKMSPEAFEESVDAIRLAALDLHAYWMAHPQEKAVQQPIKAEEKPGRNDPCPCGSGKKFKQCCLH